MSECGSGERAIVLTSEVHLTKGKHSVHMISHSAALETYAWPYT